MRPRSSWVRTPSGRDAATLAETVAEQVRVWDRDHRGGPGPRIAAYPAGTPEERLPDGLTITKRHVRVIISWPSAGLPSDRQGDLYHPTEKE
jgi:protein-L-isoaspartate(D-aspartate) O-methyltransferase